MTFLPILLCISEDTSYRYDTAVPLKFETHGGEDVAIYGLGPHAQLLSGTHEQTHIAHVIMFAACLYDDDEKHHLQHRHCEPKESSAAGEINASYRYLFSILCFVMLLL